MALEIAEGLVIAVALVTVTPPEIAAALVIAVVLAIVTVAALAIAVAFRTVGALALVIVPRVQIEEADPLAQVETV